MNNLLPKDLLETGRIFGAMEAASVSAVASHSESIDDRISSCFLSFILLDRVLRFSSIVDAMLRATDEREKSVSERAERVGCMSRAVYWLDKLNHFLLLSFLFDYVGVNAFVLLFNESGSSTFFFFVVPMCSYCI